jgi:SSS family solute:Na+ symporter
MRDAAFVLSPLDTAIIAASLLFVVLVGLWAARGQSETARGYFLASDRLPWWIIGSAFVSTSVSSEQIVGTIGAAYQHGMAIANWEWWCLPTYTLLLLLFIPVYLKNRIATVPEFLSKRFGPLCGDIYSWVMLAAYVVVFQVPVLYGSSLVLSKLTGWSFFTVLWGTVALVGLYTIKGGLSSVMWTDAVQCVMLLGGGIVLYFVAIAKIPGGWGAMAAANPERFHLYRPPDDPMAPFLGLICGSLGVFLFYQATNQVMIQRVLAARSTWDGLMGIVFAGFINLFRPLVTCFLGFIVYFWVYHLHRAAPLENPDTAFPFALTEFASGYGLRGIILAGFLAAVMSTVSALANSTATIFALDIYKRVINRNAADRQIVRVGQGVSLLALVIAALLCPWVADFGGIFKYFQTGVTMLATPFISVFLLGMLWKRANFPGALFGLIGGLVIQCAVAFGAPMLGFKLHWLYSAFIAQVIIMAGVVAVSLATAPPDEERVAQFVWSPALLTSANVDLARPWYQSIRLWFGLYAVIWIGLYWRFW